MKTIALLIYFLFVFSCIAQKSISIDMTNYQHGFFGVVLQNETTNDTVSVNNCGIVKCFYSNSNEVYEKNFSYFYSSDGKLIRIPNFLADKKSLFYRGLYYRPGFMANVNGKRVLVNQIGNRKAMKLKIEIDSPVFDKVLENSNKECVGNP